ncbi:hypothetical protein P872_20405 [Rhodonellum psychrophilum GCM71 = DSM 17998]|uniref:Uncharacterized protein n=1 Tax=Rhodonellum psychrophilum GCM71 = DSM 17998 TaxID=1123057 RepID=U5BX54_9BACT|nr:hypothetical protein P872_20405 [Rhodonellum psychrophilum GCM71 = DSM 17998]
MSEEYFFVQDLSMAQKLNLHFHQLKIFAQLTFYLCTKKKK